MIIVYRQMERKNRKINEATEEEIGNRETSKRDTAATFRVRFRFRLQKQLNIKDTEYRFNIGQREVVISPQLPDTPIKQSEWLVMNARGFDQESEAEFGRNSRRQQKSLRLPPDWVSIWGSTCAPSFLGQVVKDRFREQGLSVRDNVHGVYVFPGRSQCQDCPRERAHTYRIDAARSLFK